MARGGTVAAAIVWRAQMRAAFQDLTRDLDVRLAGVVARLLASAARILWNAARLGRIAFVLGRPPICGPFPHIADHIVEAVAVGRKRGHRRRALVTIEAQILARKFSLPGIRQVTPGREFVAPGELCAVEPAARR